MHGIDNKKDGNFIYILPSYKFLRYVDKYLVSLLSQFYDIFVMIVLTRYRLYSHIFETLPIYYLMGLAKLSPRLVFLHE